MTQITFRLRAYAPGTDTKLGFLPDPLKIDASFLHNGDGALTVDYSTLADGGALAARSLADGLDVALEANWGSGWVEPDGGRFLLVDRDVDPTDPTKKVTLTFVSYSWLLNKILNLNTSAVEGPKSAHAGMRKFTKKDAGDIVKTFLDEHDARPGAAVPITRSSWTTSADSNGATWAMKKTVYYDLGADLHSILDALADQNMCDYRTRGRGLRMYVADTAFTDRSATVVLDYGTDLTDAPSSESLRDVVGRVLVKGEKKKKVTVTGTGAPENYGRWEGFVDDGGVTDTDDLTADGNAELSKKSVIRGEYTRTLTLLGDFLPFRDYVVGDWIAAPAISATQRMRVHQITITVESGSPSGSIVLNERVLSSELKRAKKLAAVSGGWGSLTSIAGAGVVTQPDQADTRQAAKPAAVASSPSIALQQTGYFTSSVGLSWDPVTTATDDSDLDVSSYRVWAQPTGGEPRVVATTTDTAVTLDGHAPGSSWLFFVEAVPSEAVWPSDLSDPVSVTMPADTTPPAKPSAPTVESAPSAVSVTWDGLDYTGAAMAPDLAQVDVLMGTANPPTTVVGSLRAAGTYVGMAEVHTTQWVSLVAYDTSGNPSAATTPVSVVVKSVLDDTDLAAELDNRPRFYTATTPPGSETPPENSWWFKADATVWRYISGTWTQQTFDASQTVTAGTIITALLAAAAVTADKIAANAVTTDKLYANAVTAAKIATGAITADKISAGAIDGFVITGATVRTAASGARVVLDSSGLKAYNSDGTAVTTIDSSTGAISAVGGTITGSVYKSAASGARIQLDSNGLRKINSSESQTFYVDTTTDDAKVALGVTTGGVGNNYLTVTNAGITYWTGTTSGSNKAGSVLFSGNSAAAPLTVTAGSISASAQTLTASLGSVDVQTIPGVAGLYSDLSLNSNVATISGPTVQLTGTSGSSTTDIRLTPASRVFHDGIMAHNPTTTTSAANAFWSTAHTDGYRWMQINTSLRKWKKVVRGLDITADDVLRLEPRTWYDKTQIEDKGLDPDAVTDADCAGAGLRRIPGFIAEEVEAVDPRFATYDLQWMDDGNGDLASHEVLAGVAYDRISAALLVLAKDQQERIEALEATVAELAARLDKIA